MLVREKKRKIYYKRLDVHIDVFILLKLWGEIPSAYAKVPLLFIFVFSLFHCHSPGNWFAHSETSHPNTMLVG
jgi:hypothetical protein